MNKPVWTHGGRTGPVRKFQGLAIFACEGLICVLDEREGKEGEATIVTPADMQLRITAIMRRYRNETRSELARFQRRELDAKISSANDLETCVKEARNMGDPSDPLVQAWWSRHRRSSTVRFGVSAGSDKEGYPELPIIPLGKYTGRTAAIDHEAVVPPNVHSSKFPAVHRRPMKKNRSGIILDL